MSGDIRVGIGGWTFEPWRDNFFPKGLPHAKELEHASRAVTVIEINGTYYRLQTPKTFAGWAKTAPDGFRFAVKASRFCTNRKALDEAGESIAKFVGQGLTELGDKLGPILWQLMPTKKFDPDEIGAFLKLLPVTEAGVPLQHAVEVRHESFDTPAFVDMARAAGVAIVFADSPEFPRIDTQTAGFTYARLLGAREEIPTGYPPAELDRWAAQARDWAKDGRDTYVFMINGAKVRAPAAAMALLERLRQ